MKITPRTKKKIISTIIICILVVYAILTLIPFYFLFVRTFVATKEMTDLYIWIPGKYKVSKKLAVHSIQERLKIEMPKFKQRFGIPPDEKLKTRMTIADIAEKYDVPMQEMIEFFETRYRFHGWLFTLSPKMVEGLGIYRSMLNSVIVTVSSLALMIALSILTGFVIAGFRKRWHFYIYTYYLISLIIPPTLIMVPKYILMNYLHLINTFFSIILPFAAGSALSTMIFTSYIGTIPKDFSDAVKIDGGSRFQYLWHVVVPLCIIPIGALTVIELPQIWNQFLEPLLYLEKQKLYTLQLYLRGFLGHNSDDFQAFNTAILVSIIPMLAVYLSARKLFVKSLMAGAIKG